MPPVADFFHHVPMQPVASSTLDSVLAESETRPLTILFLWGRNCPNCDIAKGEMRRHPDQVTWPDVRWLHCNVYDDPEMATRFGLHGIPVFLIFRGKKSLGRITSWPGLAAFTATIAHQSDMIRAS